MKFKKLSLLALFGAVIMTWTGCMMVDLSSLMSGGELEEVVLFEDERGSARDKILLIDLSGIISMDSSAGWFSRAPATPDYITAVLNKAREDKKIKAVLLRVNSPGGGVSATDMITYELNRFTESKALPFYAHIMNVAASGGYYAATSADKIYAEPTAITGSIGVIMSLPQIKGLAEKIGYDQVVIKSGEMKDMGNMFRDMNDKEQKILQDMIMSMYNRFLDVVVENRAAFESREQLQPIADGRVYTADQAVENGLIDEIAHLSSTLEALKKAARLDRADVVTYSYFDNPEATLYSTAKTSTGVPLRIDLPVGLPASRTGFHYLWQAGQ